jgi:sarcosine oxidase subunit gamma
VTDAILRPRAALASLDLARREVAPHDGLGVWANELPPCGAIVLRGHVRDPRFAAAIRAALGIDVPATPSAHVAHGDVDLCWLGPDEWLLLCPRAQLSNTIDALALALTGIRHQLVDNSGGLAGIEIRGKHARALLTHCTVYDVAKLVPGRVVGTTWGAVNVNLLCRNSEPDARFELFVRRSYADYAWRLVERAAAPYGFGVHRVDPAAP